MEKNLIELEPRWQDFVRQQVRDGHYASEQAVIEDALDGLREDQRRLAALRAEIDQGISEADQGIYVENFSFDDFMSKGDGKK